MKRYYTLLGCALLLLLSVLSLSANNGGIIVNNADLQETTGLSSSASLLTLLGQVANRITLEYGDRARHDALQDVPTAFDNLLSSVADRVRLEYGDQARHIPLSPVPAALQAHLNAIADRLALQYPDRNRQLGLVYPAGLIGDTTPPTITIAPQVTVHGDTAAIAWTTDEFTTYRLEYGTVSGNYPFQVSGSQFQLGHTANLTGLSEDVYYYRIISSDLSGNMATSQEYTFAITTESLIYLPIVVR